LKTAKPDVSKILEPGDTALGWKWLADADAKFTDPKVKLSADGSAEVKRLATAARGSDHRAGRIPRQPV
jgi:hypothetical protein